jgi:hypothetical protein
VVEKVRKAVTFLKKVTKKLLDRFARGWAAYGTAPREAASTFFCCFFQKKNFFSYLLCRNCILLEKNVKKAKYARWRHAIFKGDLSFHGL